MDTVQAKDTIMDQVRNTLENQIRERVTVVKSMFIMVNQIKDTVDVLTKVEKDIQPLVVHMDQVKDTVDVLTKVEKDILPLVVHMDQVGNTLENQIRERVTVMKSKFIMVNQIKDMDTVQAKDTIMDQVGNTLENQIRERVTVVKSMFTMVNQIKDMDTVD